MLCIDCRKLVIDYSKLDDGWISTEYDRSDIYPDLPSLRLSARNGCEFCDVLINATETTLKQKDYCEDASVQKIDLHKAEFTTEGYLSSGLEEEEDGVYEMLLQIKAPSLSSIPLHLAISADEASPAAEYGRVRRRPIGSSLDWTSRLDLMYNWINECCENHDTCYSEEEAGFLPTRVIDVGGVDGIEDPHLFEPSPTALKAQYVALSHCWGPPSQTATMLTTELANLVERSRAIPVHSMPRNFQDAVTITRLLGLRYLWIDALCIIQDSEADMKGELERMGWIYSHAYVTVAATSGISNNDGFLQCPLAMNNPAVRVSLPFCSRTGTRFEASLYVQVSDGHVNRFERNVDCSPWNSRGWTFQERFLSKRILHFGEDQIYFECHSSYKTEGNDPVPMVPMDDWGRIEEAAMSPETPAYLTAHTMNVTTGEEVTVDENSAKAANQIASASSRNRLYERWYRLVAAYSDRKLTYAIDKLPAISGLAYDLEMSISDPDEKYLAGLWLGDLAQGLLWISSATWNEDMQNIQRSRPYRAPSWSWASMDGQITWATHWNCNDWRAVLGQSEPAFKFLDADIITSGDSPHGCIVKAILTAYGKAVPVTFDRELKGSESELRGGPTDFPYELIYDDTVIGAGLLDLQTASFAPDQLWCLQIERQIERGSLSRGESPWSGLLLEKIEDKFSRVGLFILVEEQIQFFDDHEARTICLV